MSPARRSTCSSRSRPRPIPCSARPGLIATPHLGASTTEAQVNVAIQVAEQMSRLSWSAAASPTRSTCPRSRAEEAPRLRPYMELAEKLGSLVGQVEGDGITGVSIEVEGAAAAAQPEADHRRGARRADAGLFGHGEHGQRALPRQGARARRARGPPRPRGRLSHAGPGHGDDAGRASARSPARCSAMPRRAWSTCSASRSRPSSTAR